MSFALELSVRLVSSLLLVYASLPATESFPGHVITGRGPISLQTFTRKISPMNETFCWYFVSGNLIAACPEIFLIYI